MSLSLLPSSFSDVLTLPTDKLISVHADGKQKIINGCNVPDTIWFRFHTSVKHTVYHRLRELGLKPFELKPDACNYPGYVLKEHYDVAKLYMECKALSREDFAASFPTTCGQSFSRSFSHFFHKVKHRFEDNAAPSNVHRHCPHQL